MNREDIVKKLDKLILMMKRGQFIQVNKLTYIKTYTIDDVIRLSYLIKDKQNDKYLLSYPAYNNKENILQLYMKDMNIVYKECKKK